MKIAEMYRVVAENLYNFMIPLCALYVLRIVICLLELNHMRHLRNKKASYRRVDKQYTEIGAMLGLLAGGLLTCFLPRTLWLPGCAVMLVLGVVGYKLGKQKGKEQTEFWRAVVDELKQQNPDMAAPDIDGNLNGLLDTLDVYDKPQTGNPATSADTKSESFPLADGAGDDPATNKKNENED